MKYLKHNRSSKFYYMEQKDMISAIRQYAQKKLGKKVKGMKLSFNIPYP